MGDTTSLVPGYPIRTSSDPRSVDNSPRHIAASHVLHRPLMPRHPPCALTHLHTQNQRKQLDKQNNQVLLARCSQPLSNTQTPHPTTKDEATTPTPKGPGVVSGPNSVLSGQPPHHKKSGTAVRCCAPSPRPLQTRTPHGSTSAHCGSPFSWCSLERR